VADPDRRPRALLVWNPVASGVTAESLGIASMELAARVELVSVHTQAKGDGSRFAEQAVREGYDALVVLGGDGTANEAVNGAGAELPIGVLPAGGTSVLPRALGLPTDVRECAAQLAAAIVERRVRTVSLGTLDGRRFTFAAGIGFDADVVQRVDEHGRGDGDDEDAERPGDLWFVREAVNVLRDRRYAEPRMRVYPAGHDEAFEAASVLVANCHPWTYAGPVALQVAPEATFEGGVDVVVIESIRASGLPRQLLSLIQTGRHARADVEGIHYLHDLDGARIECDEPLPAQLDGESIGELRGAEIGVVRNAASFLV
jgi:diacylglycerol kinase family enzyme